MKTEKLDAAAAIEAGKKLPYALLRFISAASLGPTPEDISTDELEEARFFNETEEIRVFRTESGLNAVRVESEETDAVIQNWRTVDNKRFGQRIRVTKTLGRDEDGQAYIADARLSGWEGGNVNG